MPEQITPLPPSGSQRQYYRIQKAEFSVIGAFNPDKRENEAFTGLTEVFLSLGLPVPRVLAQDKGSHCYLLSDLGNTTLFSLLPHGRDVEAFNPEIIAHYKRVIELLPIFQVDAAQKIDFSICYPRHSFDRRSMMWDLNYFKYYFS